jgi:hypothetical protein
MAAHITATVAQQGQSYTNNIQVTEAETEMASLNVASSLVTATFYADEDRTILLGTSTPANTVFAYNPGSAGTFTIYCQVASSTDSVVDTIEIEVLDYKPIFTLVNYGCKNLNESTSIEFSSLTINELDSCKASPLAYQVQWKVYFKDVQVGNTTTISITDPDDIDLADLKLTTTFTNVGKYLIECRVQNCNDVTVKTLEVTVCGGIKIRKINCSTLRLYNSKTSSISYVVEDMDENTLFSGTVPAVAFVELKVPEGIFKITADSHIQYFINWCTLDKCYTDIINILLCKTESCTKCCEKNANLFNRFLSMYNLYKQMVDVNEIYEINYSNVDNEKVLTQMFEAKELALKLKTLCDNCLTEISGCGC